MPTMLIFAIHKYHLPLGITMICVIIFLVIIIERRNRCNMDIVKTMKLRIHAAPQDISKLEALTRQYADACSYVSQYIFDHGFTLNFMTLQEILYHDLRDKYGLKSQFAISVLKTTTARYKTVKEQLHQRPYRYKDENDGWCFITRTLEWLQHPVVFRRPQADLVRNRDYSFVKDNGQTLLSLNTLGERIRVPFDIPENFNGFFDGSWKFGGGKIVSLNGNWYFHISMTKPADTGFSAGSVQHVVGIDRGLRFLATAYDESGETTFFDGKQIMAKRDTFQGTRAELQSKGTRSAKRALKRISGRENRWMSDVNHQVSKTLVTKYGPNTLFAVEDLAGVSFNEETLCALDPYGRRHLRSWTFYQLEQFLAYKAHSIGSEVLKVKPDYTSQRCPKCGRIHKDNRDHKMHEYVCDRCGYRSNDDRVGAMNIQLLGTMYVSGDTNPRFGARKEP